MACMDYLSTTREVATIRNAPLSVPQEYRPKQVVGLEEANANGLDQSTRGLGGDYDRLAYGGGDRAGDQPVSGGAGENSLH